MYFWFLMNIYIKYILTEVATTAVGGKYSEERQNISFA